MRPLPLLACTLILFFASAPAALAQTGRINGQVTDASSGEPIPGVNVVLLDDGEPTTQGAQTNPDGFYTILNVSPGAYSLRASFVGYATQVHEGVNVNIDLTTEVNFEMQEATVGLDEITVEATEPVVRPDVSANVANLNPEQYENLPVAGVSEVIDLQAGVESGMQIRGGGLSEVSFMVDGMTMRTGRANEPFTGISYTSVEQVQVQTGGFNAEYGNVRAGIVNIATKNPPRDRYTADALFRYTPAQPKSMGGLPEDPDSYYMRPALDPEVNMEGTSQWDIYEQRQYNDFDGWNSVAEGLQQDGFDVTPGDLVELFKYTHRKSNEIDIPDYEVDVTVGGPLVPGLSEKLGDLRFLASYRGTQTAYMYPQTDPSFDERTYQLKLTSDIAPGVKFTLQGLYATEQGANRNRNFPDAQPWKGNLPNYPWQQLGNQLEQISRRGVVIFSDGGFNQANIDHLMLGGEFQHTLSSNTFYKVRLQRMASDYRTPFPNLRDATFVDENGTLQPRPYARNGIPQPGYEDQAVCFGGDSGGQPYCVGEEPFGFAGEGGNLFTGETTGGHWSKSRDTSSVSVWTGSFDLTSQLNQWMQVKTGLDFNFSQYDMRYGQVNLALEGATQGARFPWSRNPIQGAAYAQTTLDFEGMIANLGVRLDYFNPNTQWWEFGPYEDALIEGAEHLDDVLAKSDTETQLAVSPRVGVSFPITENNKIYFNYGHFRQMLNPSDIFGIEQSLSGGIDVIGNPSHPMPKTVAYELGYDQNLFDLFLLRISGFYRDIRNQPRDVTFESLGGIINYESSRPWNYEDIRGAEFTISKNRGKWIRGFANYTFLTTKEGNFGLSQFDENAFQQRQYLRTSTDYRLQAPQAQPFARLNLQVLTPKDFGPEVAGTRPLSDWRLSVLGEWRSGERFIWSGGGGTFPELQENVSWRDYWNFDLRFTKQFNTSLGGAQFFLDLTNVFNIRHLYRYSAFHPDNRDWDYYMWSLHLPEDTFDDLNREDDPYLFIYGDDQPGDFREPGVPFQPIEVKASLPDAPDEGTERAWYYPKDQNDYFRWENGAWVEVPEGDVDQALEDKAYIDMPNLRFNTFLNPRRVTLGLRVTL